jgi:alpha-beta hydrolase superfamily lysophospholipase
MERVFSIYRFDNRGHGRSDGAQSYIEDFNTYLDDADIVYKLAKKENPELPIFMFGHSMGGLSQPDMELNTLINWPVRF